jgi:uncharacterized membrane protein (UPF0127 family)
MRGNGITLIERCGLVETPTEAMAGLLPRKSLAQDEGLWFRNHSSVHTFFMRFAIDVAFVDKSGRIVALYHSLKPWRHTWIHVSALRGGILETRAGLFRSEKIEMGEELRLCLSS